MQRLDRDKDAKIARCMRSADRTVRAHAVLRCRCLGLERCVRAAARAIGDEAMEEAAEKELDRLFALARGALEKEFALRSNQ